MEEQAFAQRYSTQEKLLLAQAVHKLGAAQWEGISSLLVNHPCLANKEDREELFSAKACEEAYVGLMTNIGTNVPVEGGTKPHAKAHLRLAQTHYFERMAELKVSIATYEQRFATLMSEIQMIKSGEMDAAIATELRAILARKVGKKLLDAWVPEPKEVREAAEAGPTTIAEKEEEEARKAGVQEEEQAPVNADPEIAEAATKDDTEAAASVGGDGRDALETAPEPKTEPAQVERPDRLPSLPAKSKKQQAAEAKRRKAEEAEAAKRKKAEAIEARAQAEKAEQAETEKQAVMGAEAEANAPAESPLKEGDSEGVIDNDAAGVDDAEAEQEADVVVEAPAAEEDAAGEASPGADHSETVNPAVDDEPDITAVSPPSEQAPPAKPIETTRPAVDVADTDRRRPTAGTRKNTRKSAAAEDPAPPAESSRSRNKRGRQSETPARERKERVISDSEEDEAVAAESPHAMAAAADAPKTERSTRRGKISGPPPTPTPAAPAEAADVDAEMPEQDAPAETAAPSPAPPQEKAKTSPTKATSRDEQRSPAKPVSRGARPETRRVASKVDVKKDTAAPVSPVKTVSTPAPNLAARPRSPSEAASELSDLPESKSPEPTPVAKPPARKPLERKNTRGKAGQKSVSKKSPAAEGAEDATEQENQPVQEVEVDQEVPTKEADEAPLTSTRASKRKAEEVPAEPPAGKRRGRRGTSTAPTIATIPDSDVEESKPAKRRTSTAAETPAEEAEEPASGSRRAPRRSMPAPPSITTSAAATRRGRPPRESPALSALTRASSPATSRRAQSVSSTKSATPASKQDTLAAAKRKPGRPPRGRNKEITPADSEHDDEPPAEQEEEKPTRISARKRGVEVSVDLTPMSTDRASRRNPPAGRDKQRKDDEEEQDEEESAAEDQPEPEPEPSKRPKRGSLRMSHPVLARAGSEISSASASVSPKKRRAAAAAAAADDEGQATPAISESAGGATAGKGGGRTSLGGESSTGGRPRAVLQTQEQKRTAKLLLNLLEEVSAHKNGNLFQKPVRKSDAPDYFDKIKNPMDLKTVKQRVRDGQISGINEFERDIHLIFANAMAYNEEGTQMHDMAQDMLQAADTAMAHFRTMQRDVDERSETGTKGSDGKKGR